MRGHKGLNSFEENLRSIRWQPCYMVFVTICMSSGLSTADGAGLDTLGFTEALAEKMMTNADFSEFANLKVDMNNYYLATK